MNRFYKGYDDITASEPFKQRMVRTLQSETKGETAAKPMRLPIRRRTLAILIAAAILVLAIGTAAAATIIGRKYYSPSAYLMNGKDEREQNEQAIPDIENAIASAKPETGETSIVMLPEMENADELNAWRQKMGQPVYSEEDWGWIREIRPEIEEVLLDGNNLSFNVRLNTEHGMLFSWERTGEGQMVDALCEEAYYTVISTGKTAELQGLGTGTIPNSVSENGVTLNTECDLDTLKDSFPTEGKVHVVMTIGIRDAKVDDMADIGLLAKITYSFDFDASAGADVAAPIVTERALAGRYTLSVTDVNGRMFNMPVNLNGVVLEETVYFRNTGIYVRYRIKTVPDDWTDEMRRALLNPSFESDQFFGFSAMYMPDCSAANANGEPLKPGHPSYIPAEEMTVILPIFPSDYEYLRETGYGLTISLRCIDTFNGQPVGDDWQMTDQDAARGEWDMTSREQPIISFMLPNP